MATNGSDPLVVSSKDLRELLERELGGHYWISIAADVIGIDPRNIYRKLYKQKFITLSVVDLWLTKLELQYELDPDFGSLAVVANPRWSQEKWHNYMKERGCV